MPKRSYQSHKFLTRCEFAVEFQKKPISRDRLYMTEMMKPIKAFLDQQGITKYQNFYQLFHNNGLKSRDIAYMSLNFINYINSFERFKKIDWIKLRELMKSNSSEKNMIMNRLALEYSDEMVEFVYNYILKIFPYKDDINTLIEEFKSLIEQLERQNQIDVFLKRFKSPDN